MNEFRVFRALGLAFKAWFRNFIPITLLGAILYGPVIYWITTMDPSKATTVDQLVQDYFAVPIYVLTGMSTLMAPLIIYKVVQGMNGTRVSFLTSVKYGLRGIIPALIVGAITTAIQLIPGGFVTGLASMIVLCYLFVASPAAVVERLNPVAALSRSVTLTAGRRGPLFALLFLFGLVVGGLMLAWIVPMVRSPGADFIDRFKSATLMVAVLTCVSRTYIGIVEAVSYALLRQDKDGVTHEELARVFE